MAFEQNPTLELPGAVLPHTDPILWVDKVMKADNVHVRAAWQPEPAHFRSHGVLDEMKLVEAIAQAGAYAMFRTAGKGHVPLFGGIESAIFGHQVREGDEVLLDVSLLPTGKKSEFLGRGFASVGGEVACATLLSGVIMPEKLATRLLNRNEIVDGEADSRTHSANLDSLTGYEFLGDPRDRMLDGVSYYGETHSLGFWLPNRTMYDGHEFGGQPILPGIRQVGALRDLAKFHAANREHSVLDQTRLAAISEVTFVRPIRPTERLDLELEVNSSNPDRYAGLVKVGGVLACQANLIFDKVTA